MKTKTTKVDKFTFVLVSPQQAKQLLYSKAIIDIFELFEDDSENRIELNDIKDGKTYGFEAGFEDDVKTGFLEIHEDTAEVVIEKNIFPILKKENKYYIELER